eukprot:scaffold295306_cov48-Prasinocladus_malaysianus.AAC.1
MYKCIDLGTTRTNSGGRKADISSLAEACIIMGREARPLGPCRTPPWPAPSSRGQRRPWRPS